MPRSRTDLRPVPPASGPRLPAVSAALGRLLTGVRRWLRDRRPTTPSPLGPVLPAFPADTPLPPDLQAARAAFHLPPRGRYERPATLDQKRALERHGGRDYDLIDSLGCEQAKLLLGHLAREDQTRLLRTRREAGRRGRARFFAAVLVGLIVLDALIVTLIFAQGGTLISQDSVVYAPRHAPTPAPPPAAAGAASAAPVRAARPPAVPRSAAFRADVAYSRAKILARYPDLAVPGSAFNARFVARYQAWQDAHDPRLDHSNWPEALAYDCAAHPAPAASR